MKKLKWMLLVVVLLVAGCSEEFLAGATVGAAATAKLLDDTNAEAIELVNDVKAKAKQLNETREGMVAIGKETVLIKPETIEALKSLKGREKDPVTWLALASVLVNSLWAGRTIEKKIKKTT